MTAMERFLRYMDMSDPAGCWPWIGFTVQTDTGPRGRFNYEGRNQWAHRVSFLLFSGPLGPDEFACHTCDFGLCTRPSHLFAGTNDANIADKVAKGRGRTGLRSWTLTAAQRRQVAYRLLDGEPCAVIARDLGVTRQAVTYLKRRSLL